MAEFLKNDTYVLVEKMTAVCLHFFADCFRRTISYGKWTAVMTTFLASTFLHGFNFQLGSVLLSLGFFTFIEDKIRSRLATIFNASIGARKGAPNQYLYQEGSFPVLLANTGMWPMSSLQIVSTDLNF